MRAILKSNLNVNFTNLDTYIFDAIGLIEIIAGLIVLKNPKIGGYIVASWLVLIALSLLVNFSYVNIAIRDISMAITAFSMARLSKVV